MFTCSPLLDPERVDVGLLVAMLAIRLDKSKHVGVRCLVVELFLGLRLDMIPFSNHAHMRSTQSQDQRLNGTAGRT